MLKVSQRFLFFIGGLFFIIPAIVITKRGITTWIGESYTLFPTIIFTILVFSAFCFYIFNKVFTKNLIRVNQFKEKVSILKSFSLIDWIIIIFMMSFGIIGRKYLFPNYFIAFFYPGLGTALFITSLRFFNAGFKANSQKNISSICD